jgi:hypothetical protein
MLSTYEAINSIPSTTSPPRTKKKKKNPKPKTSQKKKRHAFLKSMSDFETETWGGFLLPAMTN